MGDLQVRLPNQNGQFADQGPSSPLLPEESNPHPSMIPAETWRLAEQMTRRIIQKIQPTKVSEERRRGVVEYVQNLFSISCGYEVFPFGSVPLKTYLPDGDIDLTAFGFPNSEDTLAGEVRSVLEREGRNKAAEFEVKDVQYIHAEVKLVKCLVQKIVVDISFNQIGGLSTLCFLDEVDNIIGKDHLFKRTIILIKAWCYYESRILGAHHSLISTYALETLVLYIFHLFHSSLDDPLAVLYRFLNYFSKFDWDNFCISLHGPVPVSSLPEIVAVVPETDGGELLLSREFLNKCGETYSVTPRVSENSYRPFVKKHLNIVDPLKENNNLGRSVSRGNLYRIRSAFAYGARKLGRILLLPKESISDELSRFFKNTLERHGSGERPDVQGSIHSEKGTGNSISISAALGNFHGVCSDLDGIKISGSGKENDQTMESGIRSSDHLLDGNNLHDYTIEETGFSKANAQFVERGDGIDCTTAATRHGSDLATSRAPSCWNRKETHKHSIRCTEGTSPTNKAPHAPHLFFYQENGSSVKEDLDQKGAMIPSYTRCLDSPSDVKEFEISSNKSQLCGGNQRTYTSAISQGEPGIPRRNDDSSAESSLAGDEVIPDARLSETHLTAEDNTVYMHDLADLSGDHDRHYMNFVYAQRSHDLFVNGSISSVYPSSSSLYAIQGNMMFPPMNGFIPSPPFSHALNYYSMNPALLGSYGMEGMPKPRGTGTYFPNMNHRAYRDKPSLGRGRNSFSAGQVSRPRNNGRFLIPPESNLTDVGGHEAPPSPARFNGNGRGKPGQLEFSQPPTPDSRGFPHSNGITSASESQLEFGSLGPVPLSTTATLEPGRNMEPNGPHSHNSGSVVSSPLVQRPGMGLNHERLTQSYRLKDDDEFPPLAGRGNQNVSVNPSEPKTREAKR